MAENIVYQAIKELRAELNRINHIIRTLEALSTGKRPRGRPPKFLADKRPLPDRRRGDS